MPDITLENLSELLFVNPLPSITGWNRLEARPRAEQFDRSLKAEIRDPLWMLTRQWQFGEFKGEDAGSPVWARIKTRTTRINRFQAVDGEVKGLNYYEENSTTKTFSPPLEAIVEREKPALDLPLRLQMGRYWLKMLQGTVGLTRNYAKDYLLDFPFALPARDEANGPTYAHQDVWQLNAAITGRSMDGGALFERIMAGNDPWESFTPAVADQIPLRKLGKKFTDWFVKQYNLPGEGEDAWAPSYLEYQFKVAAPENPTGTSQTVLVADQYHQGRLDWYNFDVDKDTAKLNAVSSPVEDAVQKTEVKNFIPSMLEFPGMPNPRWWEFEDRRTHFGDINASTTDLSSLMLIEFGLIYANDWFVLPYDLDAGTLATVEGLAITDNFGLRFWIPASGSGSESNWERWAMFQMNHRKEIKPSDTRLFLAPAAGKIMESPPLEQVNFIRDEMANMVWGVESRIPLQDGTSRPGGEASNELRKYLETVMPDAPAPVLEDTGAKISYQLQTQVPEHWIPFIPVRVPGSDRQIQLQRAGMLRVIEGKLGNPRVEPRSELLRVGLESNQPYFVHEEEVPRAGAMVNRTWQRARWYNGKVHTWLGRRKTTGRGEGYAGLRFDQAKDR
ncbi:MAG: hypothetical protein H6581_24915 [Bacteroidia bacterium]|nr:hypothetical protein [Bacteroidia bacterium]